MLVFVTGAFAGAGATGFGTHAAQRRSLFAVPNHERRTQPAQVRAIAIQLDAASHHRYVVFAQAGGGTVLAGLGTAGASLDTGFVAGIDHGLILQAVGTAWRCRSC